MKKASIFSKMNRCVIDFSYYHKLLCAVPPPVDLESDFMTDLPTSSDQFFRTFCVCITAKCFYYDDAVFCSCYHIWMFWHWIHEQFYPPVISIYFWIKVFYCNLNFRLVLLSIGDSILKPVHNLTHMCCLL